MAFSNCFVDILTAADESDGRHAVAALVHSALGSLHQTLVVRQTQIVVGAEIQNIASRDLDLGALRRLDYTLALIQPGSLDLFELLLQILLKFSVHGLKVLCC